MNLGQLLFERTAAIVLMDPDFATDQDADLDFCVVQGSTMGRPDIAWIGMTRREFAQIARNTVGSMQ